MEKIGYHNGKEYFRLNRAGSAHAVRKATENKKILFGTLGQQKPSESESRDSLNFRFAAACSSDKTVRIAAFDAAESKRL